MTVEGQVESTRRMRFEALADRSRKKVFNLAYRLSMNRQEAEDLTQEAFFRAYRNFESFEGDKPFENWIFRIVTRLFLDANRAKRRRVQAISSDAPRLNDGNDEAMLIEAADNKPTPEQMLLQNVLNEDLAVALNTLQPEQRALVHMADVENIPYQQIAEQIGVPVGTVRSRLHRAHRKLRMMLNVKNACGCSSCNCGVMA